jgi:uncharacterized protein YjbJ (UPF0337 family)
MCDIEHRVLTPEQGRGPLAEHARKLRFRTPAYRTHGVFGVFKFFNARQETSIGETHYDGSKETDMNRDIVEGNWKQLKGKVKTRWGKLTDDHLDVISGKRMQFAGEMQEAFGAIRSRALKNATKA